MSELARVHVVHVEVEGADDVRRRVVFHHDHVLPDPTKGGVRREFPPVVGDDVRLDEEEARFSDGVDVTPRRFQRVVSNRSSAES